MKFITDIKSSLYNRHFYAGLKERSLGSSFKYFFSLVAVLAVISAFVLGLELSPFFSTESLKKMANFYPKELAIQIKGGAISTNVAEPYIIKDTANYSTRAKHGNLLVIDTQYDKNNFSAGVFAKYDTQVLIGKDFFVNAKSQSQFEFTDASKMPDYSLNQARLLHWADVVGSHHLAVSLGLFFALFTALFIFFGLHLLWLLLVALIIFLFAKLAKLGLSYKNSFQTAIHASTVPIILESILMFSGFGAPFKFFFSLVLLVIALLNLKKPSATAPAV